MEMLSKIRMLSHPANKKWYDKDQVGKYLRRKSNENCSYRRIWPYWILFGSSIGQRKL
jgi:hypothetical protein